MLSIAAIASNYSTQALRERWRVVMRAWRARPPMPASSPALTFERHVLLGASCPQTCETVVGGPLTETDTVVDRAIIGMQLRGVGKKQSL